MLPPVAITLLMISDFFLDPEIPFDDNFDLKEIFDQEAYVDNISMIDDNGHESDMQTQCTHGAYSVDDDIMDPKKKFLHNMMAMMAKISADTVTKALQDRDLFSANSSPSMAKTPGVSNRSPPDSMMINGMIVRRTKRSDAEASKDNCELDRFARAGGDNADRRKIKERSVTALTHKFKPVDFSKILSDDSGKGSIGSQVLAARCALTGLLEWMHKYDCAYLLTEFPDIEDFSNPERVARSLRIDMTKKEAYRVAPVSQFADFQQFIVEFMTPTDRESSHWIYEVLQLSIDPNLLLQLNQQMEAYTEKQRGGILLFKLLLDSLDANTFENIELYQTYLKTYRLLDTEEENVGISLATFIVVAGMLWIIVTFPPILFVACSLAKNFVLMRATRKQSLVC